MQIGAKLVKKWLLIWLLLKKLNSNKIDIVLLNVDNSRWFNLIDKYDVNGIPQLTFFDDKGEFKGSFIGG